MNNYQIIANTTDNIFDISECHQIFTVKIVFINLYFIIITFVIIYNSLIHE